VNTAATLLAEGQYQILLDKPDEVATLLDRLALLGDEAKAAGRTNTLYDLCSITIPGTNLFCAQNKGYPRIKMPQLSTSSPRTGSLAAGMQRDEYGYVDLSQSFFEKIQSDGMSVVKATVPASHLKATQAQLSGAKVASIRKAILANPDAAKRRIWVTKDGYIVDGHHYWAALVSLNYISGLDYFIDVNQVDASVIDVMGVASEFADTMGSDPQGLGAAPAVPVL